MFSHIGKAKHFHRQRYPSENDLPDLKTLPKKLPYSATFAARLL
jgi:hypothetical protein